jgi:osomolarity two-component system sensor histidine kinase NIK1
MHIFSWVENSGRQVLVLDVEGTWRELTGVVNNLAANPTTYAVLIPSRFTRSIAKVTKAVALGDLRKQIEVDTRGEASCPHCNTPTTRIG